MAADPTPVSFAGAGGRLTGDAWGSPDDPTVLFFHGGGQTRHSWHGAAARLAESGWYAVSMDLRGHGQ
jgi:pimeloyl-ACP methyl ester carboxylesterase